MNKHESGTNAHWRVKSARISPELNRRKLQLVAVNVNGKAGSFTRLVPEGRRVKVMDVFARFNRRV